MKLDFDPEELSTLAKALAPGVAKELKVLLRPQGQDGDTILTIAELATYLKVKKTKIYSLLHLRMIPHFKVGRFPRFRKADIDRWLEESYNPAVDSFSNHF